MNIFFKHSRYKYDYTSRKVYFEKTVNNKLEWTEIEHWKMKDAADLIFAIAYNMYFYDKYDKNQLADSYLSGNKIVYIKYQYKIKEITMRKIICFLFAILLLGMCTAQAATFSVLGDLTEIKDRLVMDDVVFVRNKNDKILNIIDKNNNKALTLYTKSPFCYVKKIVCKNPDKVFYEIKDPVGAHGELAGYWLIGKHNEKWVIYVTLESLRSMGACFITHRTEANGNSLLISTYNHIFPGQKVSKHANIELFWDDNAQWFGMRRVD